MKKTQSYKKLFNLALAGAMATGAIVAVAPTQVEAAKSFSDVKTTNTHYNAIINLAERGIINGYTDGTFKPGQAVNRGHAAKIIAEVLGLDTKKVTNPGFKDVTTAHPYYGAIAALANEGIIKGFPDGTYGDKKTLTRGQMATIIANAFDLTSNGEKTPFTDIAKDGHKANIEKLFANGVTIGTTKTTYAPAAAVTRGQFATFVVKGEKASTLSKKLTSTLTEVTDGQIVTAAGTFTIDGDLAKVFNSTNATALDNAKVVLLVEYLDNTVASVDNSFLAAAAQAGRVVGVQVINFVNDNTTFNAQGFTIPQVVVSGSNVAISNVTTPSVSVATGGSTTLDNVAVQTLTVEQNANATLSNVTVPTLTLAGAGTTTLTNVTSTGSLTVGGTGTTTLTNVTTANVVVAAGAGATTLNNVTATTVTVPEGARITLDANTTIGTLTVPVGKTAADVVTNYEAVKGNITSVETTGGTTPPVTPPPAGGGGGGGDTTASYRTTLISKIVDELDLANKDVDNTFLTAGTLEGSGDAYNIEVKIRNEGAKLSDLVDNKPAVLSIFEANEALIDRVKFVGDADIYDVTNVTEQRYELKLAMLQAIARSIGSSIASDSTLAALNGKSLVADIYVENGGPTPIRFTISFVNNI